jgi:hypothetical protein
VSLVSRRYEKIYNVVQRSSRRLQGYTHAIWGVKGITLLAEKNEMR